MDAITAAPTSEQQLNGDLVRAIADGDDAAEQSLVSHFWRGLFFILYKRVGDRELAADLTQDTFVIVLRHARDGSIHKPDAISSYIRRVGINTLIDHQRKQQRRKTNPDSERLAKMPDQARSLLECVASDQVAELVRDLVSEMKIARDRELLKRFYLLSEDKPTICAGLDLSVEHFDRVLYRARQRLKEMIMQRIDAKDSNLSLTDVALVLALGFSCLDIGSDHGSNDQAAPAFSIDLQLTCQTRT